MTSTKSRASEKPRVAVIHPSIWRGGSETCALWAVEALKKRFNVTLITSSEVNLEQLNQYYGTFLKPDEVKIIRIPVPVPLRWIKGFFLIRYFRLARYCKKVASQYKIMFSSYNPMDFGLRGIQYVLDPNFDQELLNKIAGHPKGLRGLFYRDSPLRWFYRMIYLKLSGTSPEGYKLNQTLADSDWTGKLTQKYLGLKTTTVYPPVLGDFKGRLWRMRDNGFICLGRINREKKIEKIIDIVDQLNAKGFELHLHIIGTIGDSNYYRLLKNLIRQREWIHFEIGIPFSRKKELLETHRYGIQGRENEPFGIAPAEMAKAGCLVWVPSGGGQVEIIGDKELIYNNQKDAITKISAILASSTRQTKLRRELGLRAKKFSTQAYMRQISKICNDFLL